MSTIYFQIILCILLCIYISTHLVVKQFKIKLICLECIVSIMYNIYLHSPGGVNPEVFVEPLFAGETLTVGGARTAGARGGTLQAHQITRVHVLCGA